MAYVFGFVNIRRAGNPARGKVIAQHRQRFLVEKPGQVEAGIRQKLTAPEADEQSVELFFGLLGFGRF